MRLLPKQPKTCAPGVSTLAALPWTLAALLCAGDAHAVVVEDLRAIAAAGATNILITADAPLRHRTQPGDDGRSIWIDFEDATLGSGVPRLLPVSDARIDGVLVLSDEDARIVRLSVDLAQQSQPELEVRRDGNRLLLVFGDAGAVGPAPVKEAGGHARRDAAAASRAGASTSSSAAKADGRVAPARRPAARDSVPAFPAASIGERPVVILDPGHGGKDPGARAWTGEWEKDIVLDLAERVARRLRDRGDIEVVMTRSADEYVELADRREASRRWGADAFVSIHANASDSKAARGIETYYYARSGGSAADPEVRRLARAENAARNRKERSTAGVSKTSSAASAPPLRERRAESIRLAKAVQGELVSRLGMRYEAVRDLGAKEGPFFVIGNNAAPSVLVEAAFLTHREEGVRMGSEVFREQIADGVARGIVAFLEQQRRSGAL